jgi:hypothetical protein
MMKRIVLAVTLAVVFSLVAGGVLIGIASAAAPGGLEMLSQALTSVSKGIASSTNSQAVTASGVRGTTLSLQPQLDTNTATNADQVDIATFKQPKGGVYCNGGSETSEGTIASSEVISPTNHPVGEKLETELGVPYADIMGWFCDGYGFGEISQAYTISQLKGVGVDEVFAMRASGMGWGKIKQYYELIGKGSHPNNGNGNGNGQNSSTNGNGKGKGHSKTK